MEKLVENGQIILDGTEPLYSRERRALKYLEKYQDMQDYFGIDLDVVLDVVFFQSGSIYVIHPLSKKIVKGFSRYFDQDSFTFMPYYDMEDIIIEIKLYFTDYKKTWAFNKEDLEHVK